MAIQPQKREIDGYTFTVSQLPGMRGLKVFARLGKMLGKGASLSGLFTAASKERQAEVLLGLLGNVDEDDVAFIAKELFTPAVYADPNGNGGNVSDRFDVLFQGNLLLLFKALAFALQVNYGDFFRGLGEKAAAAAQAAGAAQPSSSPTT